MVQIFSGFELKDEIWSMLFSISSTNLRTNLLYSLGNDRNPSLVLNMLIIPAYIYRLIMCWIVKLPSHYNDIELESNNQILNLPKENLFFRRKATFINGDALMRTSGKITLNINYNTSSLKFLIRYCIIAPAGAMSNWNYKMTHYF